MGVDFGDVPIDVRRRAARALATLSAEHAPAAREERTGAHFGRATPIFRPDLKGPAYWEIEIGGVATIMPTPKGETSTSDCGFIIVATGPHDVPIPHFSLDLAPPSRRLAQYGDVARIVKLDALCYAAEDGSGRLIGHIGTMPPKLTGMPSRLPARLPGGWSTTAGKDDGTGQPGDQRHGQADDERAGPLRLRASREKRPVALTAWRSWNELTRGYAATYRHHLAALAEHAAPRWEIERRTDEFGEGIRSGVTHTVVLLTEGEYTISGPAAGLVTAELNPQPLPPRLLLTPRADVGVADTSFSVHIGYRTRETEELRFFIVPDRAPTSVTPAGDCLIGKG